jgi:hypothetical protein
VLTRWLRYRRLRARLICDRMYAGYPVSAYQLGLIETQARQQAGYP